MTNPTMKLPAVERVIPTSLIVRESTQRRPAAKSGEKPPANPPARPAGKRKSR